MTSHFAEEGAAPGPVHRVWSGLSEWARRTRLETKLAIFLTVVAIGSGVATYAALTESPPIGQDPDTVFILLNINLVILLLLGAVVARRVVAIFGERRRGRAGSRLHVRLAARFSIVAVAPAILVATFSAFFLQFGIQSWFSERVSTAINESLSVAEAYLLEHQQVLRGDALAMANDLNREAPRALADPAYFNQLVDAQAGIRDLTEAMVMDEFGRVLARSRLTFALQFEPISQELQDRTRGGNVVLLSTPSDDRVRAVLKLDGYVNAYLYVGRFVEPQVIAHMERAQGAVAEYRLLQSRVGDLQITFTFIYAVVSLLMLLVAVWLGLIFADSLTKPIGALITAAERVRAGDLTARVSGPTPDDELGSLSRAFNRMTSQLDAQRRELIEANRQLDQRRRLTETILTGVSSGVLGLDDQGRINLPNSSACSLLGMDRDALDGRLLGEAIPEMAELMETLRRRGSRFVEGQVKLLRGGEPLTLLVRITADQADGGARGYVVTFDDISELLSAQRKAAWADVARRIAHEIKNPLTPIQLSAERLKRRYLKEITSDPETFAVCTDTIVRQVGDIGRMVDEFSSFARMPSPEIAPENIGALVRDAIDLQSHAYPQIEFSLDQPDQPVVIPCDRRQIHQVLTNLLQNALDAIGARPAPADGAPLPPGRIAVRVVDREAETTIIVEDNGRGLPMEDRDRITEPYITTRSKGTGLGLAIVKKIVEDHGGRLLLEDRPGGGARISVSLPHGREPARAGAEERKKEPSPADESENGSAGH